MRALYGVESMPETGDNVAADFAVSRADQDAFAFRSQRRAAQACASGLLAQDIVPVMIPGTKGGDIVVDRDEHPRADTSIEGLAALKALNGPEGTVTAGNAAGVNDGAAALVLASEEGAARYGLTPRARVLGIGIRSG